MSYRKSKTFRELSAEEQREFIRIRDLSEIYEDEPDGAYFALMEENGVDTDDLCWYSDVCEQIEAEKK